MRKVSLTVLLIVVFSCTIFAFPLSEMTILKERTQTRTLWDEECYLPAEWYLYKDNKFELVDEGDVANITQNPGESLIYYPELKLKVFTQLQTNNIFSGYLIIDTVANSKVEYSLELRVDSTRSYVNLEDTPDLFLASGIVTSTGEKIELYYDTTKTANSTDWIQHVNSKFYLDFQIQLTTNSGVRSININIPVKLI